jgi:hypothetical protein
MTQAIGLRVAAVDRVLSGPRARLRTISTMTRPGDATEQEADSDARALTQTPASLRILGGAAVLDSHRGVQHGLQPPTQRVDRRDVSAVQSSA